MMPIINSYNRQKVRNRNPTGRGKLIHSKSILFQQVDIRIRMNYFGPAGVRMNEYRLDAPEAGSADVMGRLAWEPTLLWT